MKLSEQTGHEVDAYASRQVDNLFDSLTWAESISLRTLLFSGAEEAGRLARYSAGHDDLWDPATGVQVEVGKLHLELVRMSMAGHWDLQVPRDPSRLTALLQDQARAAVAR